MFSRREFLAALAAGVAVVAGELWIPGQKTIFIPSQKTIFIPSNKIYSIDWDDGYDNSIVSREYGYDEEQDYSWMRDVRRRPNGDLWHDLFRQSGVNIYSDPLAMDAMKKVAEAQFRRVF